VERNVPRRSKGPRLYFEKPRFSAEGVMLAAGQWVIRDGAAKRRTGQPEDAIVEAEAALTAYLAEKHDPAASRNTREKDPFVADVLAYYIVEKVDPRTDLTPARRREIDGRFRRLGDEFGALRVSELTPQGFRRYSRRRGTAARRELEDLRAALNFAIAEQLTNIAVPVPLPERYARRKRWLTRSEVARLVWAAWRLTQGYPAKDENGRPIIGADGKPVMNPTKRRIGKHVARFILAELYTGSRPGVIVNAAVGPTIGRGYVDLDTGVFYRKPREANETKKRAPDILLDPKLLGHIRRWNEACKRENGRPLRYVVEWQGGPVKKIHKAFRAACEAAGLGDDVKPHGLRHTAVTWALRNRADRQALGDYIGMSPATMHKVYYHADMEYAAKASSAITGKKVRR
jgi:integrase